LVAILDADKEGFLRSETALIQTVGRAARNIQGRVIMYADTMTQSMQKAISETNRRRQRQMEHNEKHGITPKSIIKSVRDIIEATKQEKEVKVADVAVTDIAGEIKRLTDEMQLAAYELHFEHAAMLRDRIRQLQQQLNAND
jgi:excinuclease ABC subunit B